MTRHPSVGVSTGLYTTYSFDTPYHYRSFHRTQTGWLSALLVQPALSRYPEPAFHQRQHIPAKIHERPPWTASYKDNVSITLLRCTSWHSLDQFPWHGIKHLFVYTRCLQQRIGHRQKLWRFLQSLRNFPRVGVLVLPDGFIIHVSTRWQ